MIVAMIALGGSAYAAKKISSKQIRTGSVGTRAVKDRSLTSLDMRRDSLGGATIREERLNANKIDARRIKTVPRANSVPKNSIGASDLGPVTRRFSGATTVANGGVGKAGADCKKGELVLGGGGRWADPAPGESIQSSFAESDTAWTAIGFNAAERPGASRRSRCAWRRDRATPSVSTFRVTALPPPQASPNAVGVRGASAVPQIGGTDL